MTKEEMIEKLIENVDDWDIEVLIDTVKDVRREELEAYDYEKVKEIFDFES
jgi:hypothetical protein